MLTNRSQTASIVYSTFGFIAVILAIVTLTTKVGSSTQSVLDLIYSSKIKNLPADDLHKVFVYLAVIGSSIALGLGSPALGFSAWTIYREYKNVTPKVKLRVILRLIVLGIMASAAFALSIVAYIMIKEINLFPEYYV